MGGVRAGYPPLFARRRGGGHPYVPQALREVPRLVAAEDRTGAPAGFMGIDGERLEMLYLLPDQRGRGLGRQLLQYGMDRYGVRELTVNEQNPGARGFRVWKRTETGEQGGPCPLLYMTTRVSEGGTVWPD